MVAGGRQGGYADCCLVSNDGNPGSPYQCSWTESDYYCFFEDLVTLRESCVQGGGAWSDASTAYLSGTLLNEDCWSDGCEVYGKRGWPGGDYYCGAAW